MGSMRVQEGRNCFLVLLGRKWSLFVMLQNGKSHINYSRMRETYTCHRYTILPLILAEAKLIYVNSTSTSLQVQSPNQDHQTSPKVLGGRKGQLHHHFGPHKPNFRLKQVFQHQYCINGGNIPSHLYPFHVNIVSPSLRGKVRETPLASTMGGIHVLWEFG